MDTELITIDGHSAPFHTWPAIHDQHLTPIHFAHANGFPAGSYQSLLQELSQNRLVCALDHRATWSGIGHPPNRFHWGSAADDLIQAIELKHPQGVIGIGHSLGAVMTLLAAAKRPDLFKQIILIEPVMFPTKMFLQLGWMPMWLRNKTIPIAKRTAKRKAVWDSTEQFIDYHMGKPVFAGIQREVMQDYARHGLRPTPSSLDDRHPEASHRSELTFPPAWESHIFKTPAYVWGAYKTLKVPCVCLRGGDSNWISEHSWQKVQRLRPDVRIETLAGLGHMAPLQDPHGVAQIILKNIK